MIVRLQRLISGSHGTFGVVRMPGWSALSIECPWLDNIRNVSCIPAGEYQCEWTMSPKFLRFTYEVKAVPGRSGIRWHVGNLAGDRTKGLVTHFAGCIGLGERLGVLHGQRAVMDSTLAVTEFEKRMNERSFTLVVEGGFDA